MTAYQARTRADVVELPRRSRGRPSPSADAIYRAQVASWCALILEIKSSMDFSVGARGWCYILENHNALRKGDFDVAEKLITDCRKSGDLPLDICAEDDARETIGLQKIAGTTVKKEAADWIGYLRNHAHESYTPISFWDDLDTYVEMGVEKLDLRNLFEPVACEEFYVPLTNFKGWSDLNARANMMRRFKQREGEGKKCVLLLCTDLDPGGLDQANKMRKNLEDLARAVGWSPENLVIIRFGLDADFVNRHRLTWIDNLETSSGQDLGDRNHPDHFKPYVQDYIREYGKRKVEANALVVLPEIGRQLCRDAILRFIPADAPEKYRRKLHRVRLQLRRAIRRRLP
jgi:hypothetical protein